MKALQQPLVRWTLLALLGTTVACARSIQLRVANQTGVALTGLSVEYGWNRSDATRWRIDSLGASATTDFRKVTEASPVPRVRATAGGRTLEAMPQDRMGESPLKPGKYTYVLRLAAPDQLIVVLDRHR